MPVKTIPSHASFISISRVERLHLNRCNRPKGVKIRALNCLGFGMPVSFTSHNIRLDDGSYTKPDVGYSMDVHPWFLAAKRILDATFLGDKSRLRIADLGCLEGGYTVEFARLGMRALGLDVRELNIDACRYVQSKVH